MGERRLDKKKSKKVFEFQNRYVFYLIIVGLFLAYVVRLFNLQIVKGSEYNYLSTANTIKQQVIFAPRGVVFDKDGEQLVYNHSTFSVWVDPFAMGDREEEIIKFLADTVGVDVDTLQDEYQAKVDEGYREIMLISGLEYEEGPYEIEIHQHELPGVRIEESLTRDYKAGEDYSHLIGYVGIVDEGDVDAGKDPNDFVGKAGLEMWYDSELRGFNGTRVTEIDKMGHIVDTQISSEDIDGADLYLSVDADLQKRTQEILEEAVNDRGAAGGAAIIMDVNTGGILSMAAYPTYDNNVFISGARADEVMDLFADESRPMYNRATQASYPPGSTYKTVTGAAALEEGVVDPYEKIETGGTFQYGGVTFQDASKRNFGDLDMFGGYENSSNIYFIKLGLRIHDKTGQGAQTLADYSNEFGLGVKSGIDLPGETAGNITTPETKSKYSDEPWYNGDLCSAAMGQGYNLVSPIQLLVTASTIANDGEVIKPHLVSKIDNNGDVKEIGREVLRRGFVSKENLAYVKQGMRQTVTSGVAISANTSVVNIAAKTGTAESGRPNGRPHAWIMGFAPYEDPEIAFVFMLEEGGKSYDMGPYPKSLIEYYFTDYKKSESQPIQPEAQAPTQNQTQPQEEFEHE